jgi:hypothetical protein
VTLFTVWNPKSCPPFTGVVMTISGFAAKAEEVRNLAPPGPPVVIGTSDVFPAGSLLPVKSTTAPSVQLTVTSVPLGSVLNLR